MGILKIKAKGTDFMAMAVKEDYQRALDEQKKERQTKDFNIVCDRLEKKYRDEAISNWN